jgi:integrase
VVIVPKVEQKEMSTWDEGQVSQFLVSIQGKRNEHLYRLALQTGMRQGELLGLMWEDIDWLSRTISVKRQLYKPVGGGFTFVPPKTRYGKRVIEVGDQTIESLKDQQVRIDEWRQVYRNVWTDYNLVFPSTHGTPQGRHNLLIEFKEYTKEAGLPKMRFDDLRHTAASLMLNHGIPTIIVSRCLGHSTPSVTLDLYGHLLPGFQSERARLMDSLVHPVEVDLENPE